MESRDLEMVLLRMLGMEQAVTVWNLQRGPGRDVKSHSSWKGIVNREERDWLHIEKIRHLETGLSLGTQ